MRPHGTGEPATRRRRTEDDGWTSFTFDMPRWPLAARLRGRHPLVRTVDRVEATVLVLAVAVAILALPVAGAIGTAVYDSLRHSYSEQADSRQPVAATVGDVSDREDQTRRSKVPATWTVGGVEHSGLIWPASMVESGDTVEVWVDETGADVAAPPSTGAAAAQAATGGVLIWAGVVVVATTLYFLTRGLCERVRRAGWDKGLHAVAGSGDGPAREQRP